MKRYISLIAGLFFIFLPIAAVEWGGLVTEDVRFSSSDFTSETNNIRQSNNLSLWITAPFTDSGDWYFSSQASIKYSYDFFKSDSFLGIFDIDLLKLSGNFQIGNSTNSISAGRFSVSDLTGKIFNQVSDGVLLKIVQPSVEYSIYAGYTGLLNQLDVAILSPADYFTPYTEWYSYAYKYLPFSLSVEIPSLFLNHTFNAQVSGFLDIDHLEKNDGYDRFYASLSFFGPIAGPLYYSIVSSIGSEKLKTITNYSAVSLQMFLTSFLTIKLNAEYASGKQGVLSPFVGFTSSPAYFSVKYPELSGVILPNLDILLTTNSFLFNVNTKLVLDFPYKEIVTKGVNLSGNMMLNAFSDLQFGLSANYFYDLLLNGKDNNFTLNFNVSLAF